MARAHRTYRGGPHGGPRRRRSWLGWVAIVLTAVMVSACLGAYAAYRKLYGNISHESVTGKLGRRPPKTGKATNVLVIGSDGRNGADAKYGHAEGERSDTLILLHLSPTGDQVTGISFPRDSMVRIPACSTAHGTTSAQLGMINSAFSLGGPACSWKTVEALTGIHVDHFVKLDFSGFKGMVDALGGVEICLPRAVHDRDSKLNLPAGRHVVRGEQALAYVRNRHGLGDGSDLGRIKRQQLFMAAMVKKVTSGDLLTDPARMYAFLDAATRSVTTDDGLGVGEMRRLASGMRGMSAGKVAFVTVPNRPYPPDPNRVQFEQPLAGRLFAAIRKDSEPAVTRTPDPGRAGVKPSVPASRVRVRVLNGTGRAGLAGTAADQLRQKGFQVVKVGNTAARSRSAIRYGTAGAAAMPTLKAVVTTATARRTASGSDVLDLIIGANWAGLTGSGVAPPDVRGVRADTDICENND